LEGDVTDDVQRALGRIEGKLDGIGHEQERIAAYMGQVTGRVGKLEARVASIFAWAAGFGAAGGVIFAIVKNAVTGE
jgi:hypothetical protein